MSYKQQRQQAKNISKTIKNKVVQVVCKRLKPQFKNIQYVQSGCKVCINKVPPLKSILSINYNNAQTNKNLISNSQKQKDIDIQKTLSNNLLNKDKKLSICSQILNFALSFNKSQPMKSQKKDSLKFYNTAQITISKNQKKLQSESLVIDIKILNQKIKQSQSNKIFNFQINSQQKKFKLGYHSQNDVPIKTKQMQQKSIQCSEYFQIQQIQKIKINAYTNTIQSMQISSKSNKNKFLQSLQDLQSEQQKNVLDLKIEEQMIRMLLIQASQLEYSIAQSALNKKSNSVKQHKLSC